MKTKQTKLSLIDSVYRNNSEYKLKLVKSIIEDFLHGMTEALKSGEPVEIRGLGTFDLILVKAKKKARNPKTGEKIKTKDHYKIKFKPSIDLKETVKKIKVKKV